MATRLDDLLDPFTPALDQALRGEGVPFATPAGVLRIRQSSVESEPESPAADLRPPEPPPPAPAPPKAPPEPAAPAIQRDRAEEIVVGFSPRRISQPEPEPAPPPPPSPEPAPRERRRTISVSRDEPTRQERRAQEEVARRVPLDRVLEVLAMAPGGAASPSELAAWFGVPTPSMESLMKSWCQEGRLVAVEGQRYQAAPASTAED